MHQLKTHVLISATVELEQQVCKHKLVSSQCNQNSSLECVLSFFLMVTDLLSPSTVITHWFISICISKPPRNQTLCECGNSGQQLPSVQQVFYIETNFKGYSSSETVIIQDICAVALTTKAQIIQTFCQTRDSSFYQVQKVLCLLGLLLFCLWNGEKCFSALSQKICTLVSRS